MQKDFLSIFDLNRNDILYLLARSKELKTWQQGGKIHTPLQGKTLALLFLKPSTRTRLSFQAGMYQLGGQAIFLSPHEIQLGRGESVRDTAQILSRYINGMVIRTFAQTDVEEMAKFASIPVINGLTDLLHPCQILSDVFTIQEKLGGLEGDDPLQGVKIAYVGDGNNMANSWIEIAARLGLHLAVATPANYAPDKTVLERSLKELPSSGGRIEILTNPRQAVSEAQVVYTDVWASMGQEGEAAERQRHFQEYQVNRKLLELAAPGALVMHCLPAHRGEEITAEVIDGPQSIVLDQAENRLHVQKAILQTLLG